jgi:hypothetical protein
MGSADIDPRWFWSAFQREAAELRDKVFSRDIVSAHSRIQELLTAARYPYVHELTSRGDDAVLVLTPEGDRATARIVDWFVSFAPPIPGWVVHRRRQPRPIDQAFRLTESAFGVDVRDALFLDVECSDGLTVMMFTSASRHLQGDQQQGLVAFLLQHLLGEEVVMASIAGGMLEPLPHDTAGLMSSADFVAFCRQQFSATETRRE